MAFDREFETSVRQLEDLQKKGEFTHDTELILTALFGIDLTVKRIHKDVKLFFALTLVAIAAARFF